MLHRPTLRAAAAGLCLLLLATAAPLAAKEWPPGVQRGPVTQADALRIAREAFPPPAGAGEPEVNLFSFDGRPAYHIWWRQGRNQVQSVSVAQETGEITGFSRSSLDPGSLETRAATVPEAEARQTAAALVQRLEPDRWAHLVPWSREAPAGVGPFADGFSSLGQYSFTWVEQAGAAVLPDNSVHVSVDRQTGEVTAYRFAWDDKVQLPAGEATVTAAVAGQQLLAADDLELAWLPVRDGLGEPSGFKLAWRPRLDLDLDAVSGAFRDGAGRTADAKELLGVTSLPQATASPPARLDREQARQLAQQLLGLPAGLAPRYESGSEREYSFYWEAEQPPKGAITYSLTYRPDLGLFTNISRGAPKAAVLDPGIGLGDNAAIPNISPAAAREKAVAFAARWYPGLLGRLRLRSGYAVQRQGYGPVRLDGYTFNFERMEGGVPVQGDGLQVTVEAKTGQWLGARLTWSAWSPAADATPTVTLEAAQAAWQKAREPVLLYARPRQPAEPYGPAAEGMFSPGPPVLVWRLLPPEGVPGYLAAVAVDARSGAPLDARGHSVDETAADLATLGRHWARRELQVMLQWSALGESSSGLAPDAPLTRIDALRLLVAGYLRRFPGGPQGRSPWSDLPADHPLYGYAAAALEAGLLEAPAKGASLAPEQPISRGEFYVLAARALGFGPLLTAPLTVVAPFDDLAQQPPAVQRAAGLLAALDVVRGAGGHCRPEAGVTRAEAAAMTVRLLVARPPY